MVDPEKVVEILKLYPAPPGANLWETHWDELSLKLKEIGLDDPANGLLDFCENYPGWGWNSDILRKLSALSQFGRLSSEQAKRLLELGTIANDIEELYSCIGAVGADRKHGDVLLQFSEKLLRKKSSRDWRWIAIVALHPIVSQKMVCSVTPEVIELITRAVEQEEDIDRRAQLDWFVSRHFLPYVKTLGESK